MFLGIALSSQVGDFIESFMKRNFGVKDTGNIIPGHGGLLDRFDGLIFATFFVKIVDFIYYMSKKKVNIFGTTGSIGQSTLQVLRGYKGKYDFIVFSAHDNVDQLIKDCLEFKPQYANIGNENIFKIKNALHDTDISLSYGRDALLDLACTKVDWSMSAIVGFSGVEISLLCAEHSKILALANKEALVCAGKLLLSICKTYNTKLIPVDSEHSAIFQCLTGERRKDLRA